MKSQQSTVLRLLGDVARRFGDRNQRPRCAQIHGQSRQSRLEPLEDRLLLSLNPTGAEQEMLEHINRMRMDPQGELSVLFSSMDPLTSPDLAVDADLLAFNDPTASEVLSEWESLTYVQPLAWHESLCVAAESHNLQMIDHNQESHQLPGEEWIVDRAITAGYENPVFVYENTTAHAKSVFHAYSDFVLNWGDETRADRNRLMGLGYHEVGISVTENTSASALGSLVVTADYGTRFGIGATYLLGVVYTDSNGNGRYDAGEGHGGVNIEVVGDNGVYRTETMSEGGYQIKLPPGNYTLIATEGDLKKPMEVSEFEMFSHNVKIDLVVGGDESSPTSPVATPDSYTMEQGDSLSLAAAGVLANDLSNGNTLEANLVYATAHGDLTLATNGSFTYTPASDFSGTDTFYYRAMSQGETSNTARVTITVNPGTMSQSPFDAQPTVVGDVYVADGLFELAVTAGGVLRNDSDPNGSPLTAKLSNDVSHGELSLSPDGSFTYVPTPGYHGLDTFTYTASNGEYESKEATVKLHVALPMEQAPLLEYLAQDPSGEEIWYRGNAFRSGTLTIEAASQNSPSGTIVELYPNLGTEVITSGLEGKSQRIDWEVASGETFFVRLVSGSSSNVDLTIKNVIQGTSGSSEVFVFGTEGDDTMGLTIGNSFTVTIDGTPYHFDDAQSVEFFGHGGADSVAIMTPSGDFVGTPDVATIAENGITYTFRGFETIVAETTGEGGVADFYDSPDDDVFVTGPNHGTLTGDGFSLQAIGFRKNVAHANSGGYDVARVYDSAGDDILRASPAEVALYPVVGYAFENRVMLFEESHAFSPGGGHDIAFLFDSANDDTFHASPNEASMSGSTGGGAFGEQSYLNRVKDFEEVHGNASGGADTANLFGGVGQDDFYGSPDESVMSGSGYSNHAFYFEKVVANAGEDGDQAVLVGSAEVDLLEAADDRAILSNATLPFLIEAIAFGQVEAIATGEGDWKDTTETIDFLLTLQGPWLDVL